MSIRIPQSAQIPDTNATKVARPVSSLQLGIPTSTTVNHILGWILSGPRVIQTRDGSANAESDTTYRWKFPRNPNCYLLEALIVYTDKVLTQGTSILTFTAGSGAASTYTLDTEAKTVTGELRLIAGWGTSDSGDQEVTLRIQNFGFDSIVIYEQPNATLTPTNDDCLLYQDAAHRRIGILEGNAIASSDQCGPHAILTQINKAWDNHEPQIFAWSDPDNVKSTDSDEYVELMGPIRHQCRQKKSGANTTTRWHVYARVTSAGSYRLKIADLNSNAEWAELSNTAFAWSTVCEVYSTNAGVNTFSLSGYVSAGTGDLQVTAICGNEKKI